MEIETSVLRNVKLKAAKRQTDRGGVRGDSWVENGEECPICAKHRDPINGEPRYNARVLASFEEGDAMLRGEKPAKWYNSLEEMLVDLDADD